MKARHGLFLGLILSVLFAGSARGDVVTLTFEGLKNGEGIENFYNGGTGSLGSSGTNYGVAFKSPLIDGSPTAIAYIPTNPIPNDPSPPTVMYLAAEGSLGATISSTMDVANGFSQFLSFYYNEIDSTGTVKVYSGLDGAGQLLGSLSLTPTTTTAPGVFTPNPLSIDFSGVAHSVVFTGGNQQLQFDDIGFNSSVPEPGSLGLLATGIVIAGARIQRNRRRNAA